MNIVVSVIKKLVASYEFKQMRSWEGCLGVGGRGLGGCKWGRGWFNVKI